MLVGRDELAVQQFVFTGWQWTIVHTALVSLDEERPACAIAQWTLHYMDRRETFTEAGRVTKISENQHGQCIEFETLTGTTMTFFGAHSTGGSDEYRW